MYNLLWHMYIHVIPRIKYEKPRSHNTISLFLNRLWAQYLQLFENKMTTMRDVSNIAKFNGQNLPTWKLGCWILFQQQNLVKLVIGEETLPVEVHYIII
jgi:hypothetical protein